MPFLSEVEFFRPGYVRGAVFDPAQPDRRWVVGLLLNGQLSTTGRAEAETTAALQSANVRPTLVVANPVPLTFWRRTMLWRDSATYGTAPYHLAVGVPSDWPSQPLRLDSPALAAARGRSDVEAFLFWSRLPIVIERDGVTYLADQRFNSDMTRDSFLVPLTSKP